ncbi:MAG: pilus assembly protein PilM [Fibrobacter sp.]|nr:pilus assembly protein PilM [Fibrobacter sp.]
MALGLISRIRGERETVGIDVGHYSIKYVKVFHNHRGGKIVMDADLERVPDGAIINGEIQRRESDGGSGKDGYEQLSEAISKLLLRHPIDSTADVVVSVNCGAGAGGVLVDRLAVKVPRGGNEAAIILQTCQSRPPFDDQDNVLDYEVVSREGDEVRVNVVAAKNALLDSWAQFFKMKSLNLSAIDVDIFGIVNAYMATVGDADANATTAIFNIGAKKMSVAFIQHGQFHSMRAMTGGSLDMVESKLCMHLGIDIDKCHEIFEKGDLSIVDGFSEADVESALQLAFEDLMAQVEFGIRYFSTAEDSEPLTKILLGGGGACIPGLKAYIAERTGIETDTVNPFRYVECDSKVFGENGLSLALSNIYAPALGLAMRKF